MIVILYVMDSLRPDHLSCYGYGRPTSPRIDELAAEGVVFETCTTVSTWTRPVAASLLTGVYPGVHKVRTRDDHFAAPGCVRLSECFQRAGVPTIGLSALGNVSTEFGFEAGFDEFHDLFAGASDHVRSPHEHPELLDGSERLTTGSDLNAAFLPTLDSLPTPDLFALFWAIDTHDPFDPPAAFNTFADPGARLDHQNLNVGNRDLLIDLYDGEIRFADHCLGELVDTLRDRNLYDDAMIVLLGDHGEAFYEHGFFSHGLAPFEELLRVPLVIKFPRSEFAGSRVEDLTSLLDVAPTVLEYSGVAEVPEYFQGTSLLPLIQGEAGESERIVFSETQSLPFLSRYVSARTSEWKLIEVERPPRSVEHARSLFGYARRRKLFRRFLANPRFLLDRYGRTPTTGLFRVGRSLAFEEGAVANRSQVAARLKEDLVEWAGANQRLADRLGSERQAASESDAVRRHLKNLGYM